MTCEFCLELDRDQPGRIFYQDDHFVAFPGLGCFVEGYTLLLPRRHVLSCAELEADKVARLGPLVDWLIDEIGQEFSSNVVVAEHGSDECSVGAGCVDHAHLHLIPVSDPAEIAAAFFDTDMSGQALDRFDDIGSARGNSYVYLRANQSSQWLWKADLFSRQFARQVCCRAVGIPHHYDWRQYPFLPEMFSTHARMGDRLAGRPAP